MNGCDVMVEAWMARKLGLPMSWDAGITTRGDRRERIRAVIIADAKAQCIAGRRPKGKQETWQELFERIYRQPLERTEAT